MHGQAVFVLPLSSDLLLLSFGNPTAHPRLTVSDRTGGSALRPVRGRKQIFSWQGGSEEKCGGLVDSFLGKDVYSAAE